MRYRTDIGAHGATVWISNRQVRAFRAQWPCSSVPESARFRFQFERNGDLCGMFCSRMLPDDAGPAVLALSDDALRVVVAYMPDAHGHRDRLGVDERTPLHGLRMRGPLESARGIPMRNMRDFDKL